MSENKRTPKNLLQRVRGSFVCNVSRVTVNNGSPINIMPDPNRTYLAFMLQTTTDNVTINPSQGDPSNTFGLGSDSQTWLIEFTFDKSPALVQSGYQISTIGFNVPITIFSETFGG